MCNGFWQLIHSPIETVPKTKMSEVWRKVVYRLVEVDTEEEIRKVGWQVVNCMIEMGAKIEMHEGVTSKIKLLFLFLTKDRKIITHNSWCYK